MRRIALTLAALLVSAPVAEAVAQVADTASLTPVNWPQQFTQDAGDEPSTFSRIATGIGGGLMGAGLGFFASQIVRGDWQDTGEGQAINRSLWTAIGASVGLTFGFRFPISGGRGALSSGGLPTGREHLGLQDLEGRGLDNAHEAISLMRPEWLLIRGNRSLAASVDPIVVTGTGGETQATGSTPLISEASTIQVYIDDVSIGGVDALRTINVMLIRDMYLLSAAQATTRWGGHNPHGGILIITS